MNFFLNKTLNFSLIIIALVMISFLGNYCLIKSSKLKDKKKSIVFIGDSNVETSIDDRLIKNSINLAVSGDSYLYTYIKLRKLIKDNKEEVDTILVSFSPHNIFENDKITSKSKIFSKFRNHYPVMEQDELQLLFKISFKTVIYSVLSLPIEFLKNCIKKITNEPIFYGKYLPINQNQVFKFVNKLNTSKLNKFNEYSNIEILYLNKIIDLLKKEDKIIMFINTPKRVEILKHRSYQVNKYQALYDSLYFSIPLIDLSEFQLDITDYADLIHLNKNGAKKVSNHINNVGLKNLINKSSK